MATNKMMKIEEVTKEELLSLKNIGEKVADMIITAREEHDGTLTKMQFMCLPLPKPSVKERIIKHQELVFSDNSGGVSVPDIDVSTDGKVKFTQAVGDIDEDMKLKVTSSDVNEAAGVVSSQEDSNMKVLLATVNKIAMQTEELTTAMVTQKVELKQTIEAQGKMFNKKLEDVSKDFGRKLDASAAVLSKEFSLKMKEEMRIHRREVRDEIAEVRDECKGELRHQKKVVQDQFLETKDDLRHELTNDLNEQTQGALGKVDELEFKVSHLTSRTEVLEKISADKDCAIDGLESSVKSIRGSCETLSRTVAEHDRILVLVLFIDIEIFIDPC